MIRFVTKVMLSFTCLTAAIVLYVHGQVAIFELSYDMEDQAHALKLKSDNFSKLKFEVEQLKAPRLLEAKMNQLKLDLTLPREIRVVKIPQPPMLELPAVDAALSNPFSQFSLDIFGKWVKVAQAKMDQ